MLGGGKAAPAQFVLRGKTNLRRISAAGQKAVLPLIRPAAPRFQIEPAYAGLRFGESGRF